MDRPIVSESAEQLYERLMPFAYADEEGGWQLLRLCEAVAGTLLEETRSWVSDGDRETWSEILSVDTAPVRALPWLAQFAGVVLQPELTEAERREAIRVHAGFTRGTVAAMRSDVQRTLSGSRHLLIAERPLGEAYQLMVRTITDETPDPVRTLAAVVGQKPAGIVLDFDTLPGTTYLELLSDFSDYADMRTTVNSYSDLLAT